MQWLSGQTQSRNLGEKGVRVMEKSQGSLGIEAQDILVTLIVACCHCGGSTSR
jgi:hypothetical protein